MVGITKLLTLALLSTICLFLSSTFAADTKNKKPQVVEGEFIVKFREGITQQQINSVQSSLGISRVTNIFDNKKFKNKNKLKNTTLQQWKKVKLEKKKDRKAVLSDLNLNPLIEYAEPNYIYSIETIPNDLEFSQLWGLNNTAQNGGLADADIDAPEAWNFSTGNSTPIVAVIDTGIDYNHEDLAANMWINTGEIAGNGIDDDNNGYVDDIYGYDFSDEDSDPIDYQYHGTHVAGTIGAVGNNGIGISGVSWNTRIMAIKFFGTSISSGTTSAAISSILYAIDNGANIINASWGGAGYSQALKDTIQAAGDSGILFVSASGNNSRNTDNAPFYPAAYDVNSILSVAATNSADNLAAFSNYGSRSVDLAAPGVSVYSTMPNNTYGILSGTSMASPHVAGAAAVLLSNAPELSPYNLKLLIMSTSDELPSLTGITASNGRLNLFNALTCDPSTSESLGHSNLLPSPGSTVVLNREPVNINIMITQCADVLPNGAVTVTFDNGEAPLTLFDDGLHNDGDAGDGFYGNSWLPQIEGSVQLTITLERDAQSSEITTFPIDISAPYYSSEQINYRWVDATNGQVIPLSDDAFQTFDIPNFSFYGNEYNRLSISSNGFMTFSENGATSYINTSLPSVSTPNNIIAPFWDDLYPPTGGQVYLLTEGVAPNRRITVSWNDIFHIGSSTNALSMQASLYETTGDVVFQYKDLFTNNVRYDYGASATVGVENNVGTEGLQISYNEAILTDLSAYRIYHTDGNRIPFIHQIGDRSVQAGDTLTFDVIVTVLDGDLVTLTMASNSLPVNADYVDNDDGTGTFTWTPEVSDVGLYSDITFTATDAEHVVNQTISIEVTEQPRAPVEIRVNAGGGEYTDGNGKIWSADYGFNTGAIGSPFSPIFRTNDQPLFDNNRYNLSNSPELMYSFTVPNAEYVVRLYFAETYIPLAGPGLRVFDIAMEGSIVWSNLDVFSEAPGTITKLVKQNLITVNDGELNVEFLHGFADHPMISAIEIIEVSDNVDLLPPTAPTNVVATIISGNQINLSWTPSLDIGGGSVVGYNIYRDGQLIGDVTEASRFNVGNLTPNTTYSFTVTAFDDAVVPNESLQSISVTATTSPPPDTQPPTVPNNIRNGTVTDNYAYLRWDASTDLGGGNVAGYNIYRDGSTTPLATTTNTLYADTGLSANTTYHYTVTAFDDATPPNESAPATISTTTRIVAPGNFNAIAVSSSQIDLSWTLPQGINVTDIAGYKIFRGLTPGGGVQIGDVSAATTSFSDTGSLIPETTYYYLIWAYDDSVPVYTSMWAQADATTLSLVDIQPPTDPTNLRLGSATDTTAYLNWNASTDLGGGFVAGYNIYRDGIETPIGTTTNIVFRDTGLTGNTRYTYSVTAFDDAIPPNESSPVSFAINTFISPPREVVATAVSSNQINLSWLLPEGGNAADITGFEIRRQLINSGYEVIAVLNAAARSYSDSTGLIPDATYDYFIYATSNFYSRSVAGEVSATTLPDTQPPITPTNFRHGAITDTTVSLQWDVATDQGGGRVAGYYIYRDGSSTPIATTTNTLYTVTGLSANTTYNYTLTAFDDATPPNEATPASISITTRMAAPGSFAATAVSSNQIDLSWTLPQGINVTDIAGYIIMRELATGGAIEIGRVSAATTSFSDTGSLIPETTYYYLILAYDNSVPVYISMRARTEATTLPAVDILPPTVPTGVDARGLSINAIQIDWTLSTDLGGGIVSGYNIYRDGSIDPIATVTAESGTQYIDTGLTEAVSYTYTVTAFDDAPVANESEHSLAVSAIPNDSQDPTIPENVTASAISADQIQINWDVSTDVGGGSVAGYQVFRWIGNVFLDFVTVTETNYLDSGLDANTEYRYSVRSFDDYGNYSVGSVIVNETTHPAGDPQLPTTPSFLIELPLGSSQIQLVWTHSVDPNGGDIFGYNIYRDGATNPIATVNGNITRYLEKGLLPNTPYTYTITALDNASPPNESEHSLPSTIVTGDSALIDVRINAGGEEYNDRYGYNWQADNGFNTGGVGTPFKAIGGTEDQILFNKNRYDVNPLPELMYSVNVPNGNYLVRTYFAETYSPLYSVGSRVFDVLVENEMLAWNVDVFSEVGAETMLVKESMFSVVDGQMNIEFIHKLANHPMVSAIEIIQLDQQIDTQAPTIPEDLTVIATSTSQIDLSWSASFDLGGGVVAGYHVYRDGNPTPIATVTGTNYSDIELIPNTSYSYTVLAVDNAVVPNRSPLSSPVSATTLGESDVQPPSIPVDLSATVISANQIDLSWVASTDLGGGIVDGYRIYRDGNSTPIATVPGTSYSDTGLTANSTYTYTVSTFDNAVPANESLQSTPAIATTLDVGSVAIRLNAGGAEYTDGLGQIWSADYGFNTGGAGSPFKSIAGTADQPLFNHNRYDVHPLPELMYSFDVPNGGYQVTLYFAETYTPLYGNGLRVFDVEMEGSSVWTNLDVFAEAGAAETLLMKQNTVTVLDGQINIEFLHGLANHPMVSAIEIVQVGGGGSDTQAPSIPSDISATAISTSQIDLSWSASTDQGGGFVAGYNIYRDSNPTPIATVTGTIYSDTGLVENTQYNYTISAFDNASPANESEHITIVSASTHGTTDTEAPSIPVNIVANAVNSNEIYIEWDASTDFGGGSVAGYRIYRNGNPITVVGRTSYSDTGLAANTTYNYTVTAYDNASPPNESVESDIATATTLDTTLVSIRVNAGGGDYTDGLGQVWSADFNFNTGGSGSPFKAIAGTTDQPLFDRNRYDVHPLPELMYSFNVPNGNYNVKLYFAETYTPLYGNGLRVFDVAMEGSTVWGNLDVFAEAGNAETMLVKQNSINVSDGQLNIEFLHGLANHPMISAIEIVQY